MALEAWSPTVPRGWSRQSVIAVDGAGRGGIQGARAHARSALSTSTTGASSFSIATGGRSFFGTPSSILRSRRGMRPSTSSRPATGCSSVAVLAGAGQRQRHAERGYSTSSTFAASWSGVSAVPPASPSRRGLAFAPRGFRRFGGDLLIANFGSGKIDTFAPRHERSVFAGRLDVTVPECRESPSDRGMSGPTDDAVLRSSSRTTGSAPPEFEVHGQLSSIAPG